MQLSLTQGQGNVIYSSSSPSISFCYTGHRRVSTQSSWSVSSHDLPELQQTEGISSGFKGVITSVFIEKSK